MNDTTTKLLEQLAAKLGTTAEHLWGVLIKQAPISSFIDVLLIVMAAIGIFVLNKIAKLFYKKAEDNNSEYYGILALFSWLAAGVCAITIAANLSDFALTLSGFINPEYWALKQLIK